MDKKTINTYNATAKEYDEETADFWEKFPTTFIDAFKKEIKGKVLDVGSGSGRDALILEKADSGSEISSPASFFLKRSDQNPYDPTLTGDNP